MINTSEIEKMHPLDRAHIILTSEKLKPASTFRGYKDTRKVLEKLELYYVLTKTRNGFVCDATYDKVIHKQFEERRNNLNQGNKIELEEWKIRCNHEYLGNIYGYPKCCIDAYATHMRNGMSIKRLSKLHNVPQELYSLLHIPCSPKCEESLVLARMYWNVLERIDPETLIALKNFNET